MNAAPLQHFERWDIHNEGTQPAVRAVTDRLDAERIAVREALGYRAPHFPLRDHYENDRWMYGDAHKKLVTRATGASTSTCTRTATCTEDMELGLAFLASVARWAGVDAPVAHGLLAIAGAFLGPRPAPGPAHASRRWAWRACDRARRMTRLLREGRLSSDGALRCRRRRPHGPRHRHRLRLRRPPRRRRRPARAQRAAWAALRAERRGGVRASLQLAGAARRDAGRRGRRASPRASTTWSPHAAPTPRCAAAELVFEGVPETLEAKREAFERDLPPCGAGRDPRLDHLAPSWSPTSLRFVTHPERLSTRTG